MPSICLVLMVCDAQILGRETRWRMVKDDQLRAIRGDVQRYGMMECHRFLCPHSNSSCRVVSRGHITPFHNPHFNRFPIDSIALIQPALLSLSPPHVRAIIVSIISNPSTYDFSRWASADVLLTMFATLQATISMAIISLSAIRLY